MTVKIVTFIRVGLGGAFTNDRSSEISKQIMDVDFLGAGVNTYKWHK